MFLDDQPLRRVLSLSELGPGKFFQSGTNVYLADNPSGRKVEYAVASRAFKGSQTSVENVTIEGLVIEKFASEPQTAAVDARSTWAIRNNEIRLNHAIGVGWAGIVSGNNIHHNGQLGLAMMFAEAPAGSNFLVENNEIAYNNYANFDPSNESGGGKWGHVRGLIVRGNYVHDNKGIGLHSDGDNRDVVFENNRVIDNERIGIQHELSFAAVIRNNTINGNGFGYTGNGSLQGAGLLLNNSSGTEIYGNTRQQQPRRDRAHPDLPPAGAVWAQLHPRQLHPRQHDHLTVPSTNISGHTGLVQWDNDGSYYTSKNNRFVNNNYTLGCYATPSSGKTR